MSVTKFTASLKRRGALASHDFGINRRERVAGYCFILPAVIFLLVLVAFPIGYNIWISLHKVDILTFAGHQPFIGFENYRELFDMPILSKAFANTMFFTVMCIIFQFSIGFALAVLFSKTFVGNRFFRGIVLICWLIPVMVAGSLWQFMFAGDSSGMINYFLMNTGIIESPIVFRASPSGSMWSLIIANIWRGVPFNMLLIATALTTLPQDVLDAASVDGAGRVKRFWYVITPILRPAFVGVLVLGFIHTFKIFELVLIMTGGGPLNATENLATLSYRLTFIQFELGRGAAVANIMMSVLIVVGFINLLIMEKDEVIS